MSRDPHPAEAGGVPRPRRRARVAGPWYHSPKAALSGLAVLIAWGLLLPGATPVGGGMSTLGSLSLFGYALFSIVGGIVFLSNAAGLRVHQFREPRRKRDEGTGGRVHDHA